MKQNIFRRRLVCVLIILAMCFGVSSQGMYALADENEDKVQKILDEYTEDELDAMTQEEYLALLRDAQGIKLTESQTSENYGHSQPDALPAKNVANAVFFRSFSEETKEIKTTDGEIKNIYRCMQNFAVFKRNNDSYILRSTGGKTGDARIYIDRRSYYGSTAMTFGTDQYILNQNYIEYDGHGDSVEVVDHNGSKYLMYIAGTPYGTGKERTIRGPYYLKCRELLFDSTGDVSLGTEKTLNLFATFDNKSAFDCKLAASDNYLCICIAYGSDIYFDRERYMVYGKDAFIDAIYTNGATAQSQVNFCRYATGWFRSSDSIGFVVPKNRTVLQSLCLDEKKDANGNLQDFIVIAAIDDRGSNSSNKHKVHYINRAYIEPKTPGSQASKTAQNMKDIHCYYSKITHIAYSGNTSYLEHDLSDEIVIGNEAERTELEGLKKIKSQGNGITAGWYVSTHNGIINDHLIDDDISIPYFGNMPDITNDDMPWNSLVYKVQMTPVQVWTGN